MVTASLNDYRQSPRKVRLVANLVKGKPVERAVTLLEHTVKEASAPIRKLLQSAIANAKSASIDAKDLIVKSIEVNPGAVLKRSSPTARGSAHVLRKRTSHITVVLDKKAVKASKAAKTDKK